MIKNIIFDWSGTLSNNVHAFRYAVDFIFTKFRREKISLEEIRKNFTLPYMKFWNTYIPEMTKAEQDRLYKQAIHEADNAFLYEGVFDILTMIHKKEIQLFVLSSDPYSKLLSEIKDGKLSDIFLEVFGEVHEKEHTIRAICKKYNLHLSETLYVGDTDGDIKAGKKANVKTGAITWGFNTKEKLALASPDFLMDDIKEIIHIL